MAKVKFLATTLTSRGRFEKGDSHEFTEAEAKDLRRLTSVESETPTINKKKVKKVKKDDSEKSTEK